MCFLQHSGRLVQFKQDARDMIGLVNGGTDYCQALTVIIDDVHGKLPLDPTKQVSSYMVMKGVIWIRILINLTLPIVIRLGNCIW